MSHDYADLERRLAAKKPVELRVENLSVTYATTRGAYRAVEGVSFTLAPGSNMGLVGESGCGKSTVIKALMRLTPDDAKLEGQIFLDGLDLVPLSERALRNVRWTQMALVTQSAMNALDPVYTLGDQIVESILAHEKVGWALAWRRAQALFENVGLPPERLHHYPHQFSGGMRQRAVIAMALSLNAGLLLADEPTTALDPIMQDQVMARLHTIQTTLQRSMILVTHDIAVVSETCERIAVMYAGQIVEAGPTREVLAVPAHPYTMGLQNAFPRLPREGEHHGKLVSIAGGLPNLLSPPLGCRFAARCPFAQVICTTTAPPLRQISSDHSAACHFTQSAPTFRAAATQPDTWSAQPALVGATP